MEDDEFDEKYLEWASNQENRIYIDMKMADMEKCKFKVEDFYIGDDEANYYLKHYATLLIYSENYDLYYRKYNSNICYECY